MKRLFLALLAAFSIFSGSSAQQITQTLPLGTSGGTLCLLTSACTWSALQTFNSGINSLGQTTIGPIPSVGSQPFVIVGDGAARNAGQIRFQNNATAPSWNFEKARGTAASPLTILTGDALGAYGAFGYDGSNFTQAGLIRFGTEGTISAGIVPGVFLLQTANSSGALTDALYIDSAQTVQALNRLRAPLIDTASGPLTFTPTADIARVMQVSTVEAQLRAEQGGTGDASFSWFLGGANEIKATAVRSAAQLRFTAANPFNFGAFDYSNGNVSWGGFPGGEAHRFVPTASALQWLVSKGGAVGVPASLDTNQGGLQIKSAGEIAARFTSTASAVNQWIASSQSTGNIPYWITNSLVDTNVPGAFGTQGSGALSFFSSGNTNNTQAQITHTPSADTYLTLTGAAAGGAPKIGVGGVGTILSITSAGGGVFIDPSNSGAAAAKFTASNSRYVIIGGSATNPTIESSAGGIAFSTAGTAAGGIDATQHWRFGNSTAPTIATNACGSTVQGTIGAGSSDNDFLLNVGTLGVTACTVSFGSTFATAPRACVFSPANTTAAAGGTTLAYVSAISTTQMVLTGTALAGASYYVHCS